MHIINEETLTRNKHLTYRQGLQLLQENAELKAEMQALEIRKNEEVEYYKKIAEDEIEKKRRYKAEHEYDMSVWFVIGMGMFWIGAFLWAWCITF